MSELDVCPWHPASPESYDRAVKAARRDYRYWCNSCEFSTNHRSVIKDHAAVAGHFGWVDRYASSFPPPKLPGIHGEGLGTGLPNDGDYADIELRVLEHLSAEASQASVSPIRPAPEDAGQPAGGSGLPAPEAVLYRFQCTGCGRVLEAPVIHVSGARPDRITQRPLNVCRNASFRRLVYRLEEQ